LAIAQDLKDFSLQVVANYFLGILSEGQGDYRRAIEFLRWNVSSSKGEPTFDPVTQGDLPFLLSRARLVLCLAELGEFQEGTTHGDEAVRVAEGVDQPYSLTLAYYGVGYLYLRKGLLDKAITTLERSLKTLPDLGHSRLVPHGRLGFGLCIG